MRVLLLVLSATLPAAFVCAQNAPKVRVFVADSEAWQSSSFNTSAIATRAATSAGISQSGNSKYTAAVMAQLYKECPTVTVINKESSADYFIRVEREFGTWTQRQNIAVFDKSGEMVFAASSGKISTDVKRFCQSPVFGGKPGKHRK